MSRRKACQYPSRSVAVSNSDVSFCVQLTVLAAAAILNATPGALERAIAEIEAGRRGTPIIGDLTPGGDVTVTFLARSDSGRTPRVVSDVTGWGEHTDGTFDVNLGSMTRVGSTDWYSLEARVHPRARIEYLIAYGLEYRLDPYNPRHSKGPAIGSPSASEFVMPGYREPTGIAEAFVGTAGETTDHTIGSKPLGRSVRILVHTPPGYREGAEYPLVVILDARAKPIAPIVDALITMGTIEPVVVAFVDPRLAGTHNEARESLRPLLTEDVPVWIASRYSISKEPRRRAILGVSYGARDALEAARATVGSYGNLGLLVPGRRITRADIRAIGRRGTHPLRVAILAGLYDHANVPTARELRDALTTAGYSVHYTEVPEGHNASTWINNFGVVLSALFPKP